ncbi:uncharacterized protein LOC109791822 [Cajanus cajan]|uniref:uncharacterized protein LOC109791822 n=1 Tax=Cajanus cajan TaxID=3821 RepID=UPI00098DA90B|nr:uncharacterized protein LOC109791822 [Cajanus cajan]
MAGQATCSWNLTIVYGSPHSQFRVELWRDIRRIAMEIKGAWCLLGDFNAVLQDGERHGGKQRAINKGDAAFRKLVKECDLIDMGFQGSPFAWKRGNLYERLDRVLINLDWQVIFPHANVLHLHPLKSNHCPIMLKLGGMMNSRNHRRPFRFEAAWLTHPELPKVVYNGWNEQSEWANKMSSLQKCLANWNRTTFGNIFFKKQRLLRRLNGISTKLSHERNDFLEELSKKLWSEYEHVLIQEELLWFQKSRYKWLELGDRNTKYFHGSTLIRRRKN